MAKYSIEFKTKVLQYYKDNGIATTERAFNVNKKSIYRWNRQAESGTLMRKEHRTYTADQKLEIIKFKDEYGYLQTEIDYSINSGTIAAWEEKYRIYGFEGLKNKRGRKPKKKLEEMSEIERLRYENKMLKYENELLKKLRALTLKKEEESKKKGNSQR